MKSPVFALNFKKFLGTSITALLIVLNALFPPTAFGSKVQIISVSMSTGTRIDLSSGPFNLPAHSSSGLPVHVVSYSPLICAGDSKTTKITPLSAGFCHIELTQSGNSRYSPASPIFMTLSIVNSDQIYLQIPATADLSQKTVPLLAATKSGAPVTFISTTSNLCYVVGNTLNLIAAGNCVLQAVAGTQNQLYSVQAQPVTATIRVSGPNIIHFSLPSSSSINAGTISLTGTATSGLPLLYSSQTPNVCTVSGSQLHLLKTGTCTIIASQAGNSDFPVATNVTSSTNVGLVRYFQNINDDQDGYKLQAIYVVPSDGIDRNLDQNGYIANLLNDGERFLQQQVGHQLILARNPDGSPSVLFLHSQYSTADLSAYTSSSELGGQDDMLGNLLGEINESHINDDSANENAHFLFFVDIPMIGNQYCGYDDEPGNAGMTAIGGNPNQVTGCNSPNTRGLSNYQVITWVHETFHGLGVGHTTSDQCDLMYGSTSYCNSQETIDKTRSMYVGSDSMFGVDVLTLPVWQ